MKLTKFYLFPSLTKKISGYFILSYLYCPKTAFFGIKKCAKCGKTEVTTLFGHQFLVNEQKFGDGPFFLPLKIEIFDSKTSDWNDVS